MAKRLIKRADGSYQVSENGNLRELTPAEWQNALDKGYVSEIPKGVEIPAGPTATDSALAGARSGVTLGFNDEIAAATGAASDVLFGDNKLADIADRYRTLRDVYRDENAAAEAANPTEYMAGNVAGSIASLPLTSWIPGLNAAAIRSAPSAASAMLRLMGQGGAYGATSGYGLANEGSELLETGSGALLGMAVPPALAAGGKIVQGAAKGLWNGLSQSARDRAMQMLRDRAHVAGLDWAQVQSKINALGPDATLADVDLAFTELASGSASKSPEARRLATEVLDRRQAGAPARIKGYLEEASGLSSRDQLPAVERGIAAGRRRLGPEYERLGNQEVVVNQKLRNVMSTMPGEYRSALGNWQRMDPQTRAGVDPLQQLSVPGAIINEMKIAADKVGRSSLDPAQSIAAKSVSRALRREVDPMLPGYQRVRDAYAKAVMQPEEGALLGRQVFSGDDNAFRKMMGEVNDLTPRGLRGFRAAALQDAQEAVGNRAGSGDQFYGGKLLGTDLAGERLAAVAGGDAGRLGRLTDRLDAERTMHRTRTLVDATKGSQTQFRTNAASAADTAELTSNIVANVKTGGLAGAFNAIGKMFAGDSPKVHAEAMKVLMSRLSQADLDALAQGQVTRSMQEGIERMAGFLTKGGTVATRTAQDRSNRPAGYLE